MISFFKQVSRVFESWVERKRIDPGFHPDGEEVIIHAHADRLEKVLSNLLAIVMKPTPTKRTILFTPWGSGPWTQITVMNSEESHLILTVNKISEKTDIYEKSVKPSHFRKLLGRVGSFIGKRWDRPSKEKIPRLLQARVTSNDEAFLNKAIAVMERHLSSSYFGVNHLADELGVCSRQLHRRFKALTGKGPGCFIRQFRLERAARLLRQQSGSVAEIAYEVGFSRPRYFSELFRKTFGKNPSQYAKEAREGALQSAP